MPVAARSLCHFVTGAVLVFAAMGLAFAARSARADRAGSCHVRGPLPDRGCTPGAVETTSLNVVCGTSTHGRRHVDGALRRRVFLEYGIAGPEERSSFDVDHLVPLELGGSNDIANLWPQAVSDSREKDRVEDVLHDRVCGGRLPLADAQRAIATDWTAVR